MTTKTHFTTTPSASLGRFKAWAVCGREGLSATGTSQVTCLNCKKQPEFQAAEAALMVAQAEAFANQTPTTVKVQWTGQDLVCQHGGCGGTMFRFNGRSLDYFDYVCAGCGQTTQVLTETGMCR